MLKKIISAIFILVTASLAAAQTTPAPTPTPRKTGSTSAAEDSFESWRCGARLHFAKHHNRRGQPNRALQAE